MLARDEGMECAGKEAISSFLYLSEIYLGDKIR
jgi:hypothetical protein